LPGAATASSASFPKGGIQSSAIAASTYRADSGSRIAIARAFLKNAPVPVLDKATSALDSDSEEAIRHPMVRLMRGRTVIAAAHRLSTVRNFDRIVVLEQGRIVEEGPPEELIRSKGAYRRLIEHEIARLSPARSAA
jgi:ATP-binding cassette subfamily B protein